MTVTEFGVSGFFKEPEPFKSVGRFIRAYEHATPAEYLAQYPNSPATEIVLEFEPVNFRLREGETADIYRMGVASTTTSKLAKTHASWVEATGTTPTNANLWNELGTGMYLEWIRDTMRPPKEGERPNYYRKFTRVVPPEEAATLKAARTPQSATGGAPDAPTVSTADAMPAFLALIGAGATLPELKRGVMSNETLKVAFGADLFGGKLLPRLLSEGVIVDDDGTYRVAP